MNPTHAIAFVDHHAAQVLQFDADHAQESTLHEHVHFTRQHASGVRSEHEFFGTLCDALDGIAHSVVVGGHTGLADFRHYVEKHRPATAARIIGFEVVDHPTGKQLVALAKERFAELERMGGLSS